jgi:DNA-binding beta-propeller fold protein YncE
MKIVIGLLAAALFGLPSGAIHASASAFDLTTNESEPRIVYLDIKGGRVLSARPDGSDVTVLATGRTGIPDGVVVDERGRHIFWTGMGRPDADDGFIDRSDLDGSHITRIVPAGGAFTPKQLKLDAERGKLYWADREGMRVMRANLDGSQIETLIETGQGDDARRDAANWCVGIALDVANRKIYWTQKGGSNAGGGSIRRAGLDTPPGRTPSNRADIEVLFDRLPEPIDLDLDLDRHIMYWTDRGDPPRGNTVTRAPMEPPAQVRPAERTDQEIVLRDLHEGIGISLDPKGGRMYVTDLGGNVYSAALDGSDRKTLLTGQGSLTGIAFAAFPK